MNCPDEVVHAIEKRSVADCSSRLPALHVRGGKKRASATSLARSTPAGSSITQLRPMNPMSITSALVVALGAILASCDSSPSSVPAQQLSNSRPLSSFADGRGPEVCLGCRLEADVLMVGERRDVQSYAPTECSTWVVATGVAHEHSWMRTGCWKAPTAYLRFGGPGIWVRDWFAYLQDLPEEQLATTMSLDFLDPDVWQSVKADFEEWEAREQDAAPLSNDSK